MEEHQFRKLLELFPIVRSSTYCAEDDVISPTTEDSAAPSGRPGKSIASSATKDGMDFEKGMSTNECEILKKLPKKSLPSVSPGQDFWDPLKVAMQAKLGDEKAQRFCEAFRQVHETLVMKTLSLDDIERIATHMRFRPEHS